MHIPVVLVTGFLGSGKTTLINRLLKTQVFARAAVLINEFGETSVDHVLVAAPRERVRVVDSGCLCGHVHEEVASSLLDLHARRGDGAGLDFDLVLVETSGLADPVPIIQVLLTDPHVTAFYELHTAVAVADGVHGLGHLSAHSESVKQAALADTIIVSKADVATAGAVETLSARLSAINPGARQLHAVHGDIEPAALLRNRFDLAQRSEDAQRWLGDQNYAATVRAASGDPTIATFTLDYEGEITRPGLVLWINLLAGFRGSGLLRVKGIVNVEGQPYAVQAVQTIVSEPVPLAAWPNDDRRSRLVFITRGMDAGDIRRTFAAFDFEGGRAPRNTVVNPATYAQFAETMQLFRTSSRSMTSQ